MEEMKGVQERAQKFGKEATTLAGERGRAFGADAAVVAKRGSRSFGDIIVFLIKLVGYFILGSICFALIVALFVGGFWAIGFFPLKDYVLKGGTQNLLAWGTLIFFILVPMLGIITWIIRRLAKIRKGSKLLRLGFISMWIAGWVFVSCLFASIAKDFRHSSRIIEQEVYLSNPAVKSLEITTLAPGQRYTRNSWSNFEPFDNADEDTAFVRNIEVHIARSANDSFRVTMTKMARGYKQEYADTLAALINFNAIQKDSQLVIDKSIAINKKDKFRNQRIILTVYVPVGKQIYINQNVGWSSEVKFDGPWSRDWEEIQFENIEHGWDEGVRYTMTKEGLFDEEGKPADSYKRDRTSNNSHQKVIVDQDGVKIQVDDEDDNGSYRYDKTQPMNKFDSMKMILLQQEKRFNDSLLKEKHRIDSLLRKGKTDDGTAFNIISHDPTIFLN